MDEFININEIARIKGSISIGTLHRWVKMFENYGTEGLLQKRKTNQQGEYNTILTQEMKDIFIKFHLYLYSVAIHCFLSLLINRILSFLNFE